MANVTRKTNAWMRQRDADYRRVKAEGRDHSTDIEAYNAKIRAQNEQARTFSQNRLRADHWREDKWLGEQLKEVWE